jgi:hypothetical protein
MRYHNLATGIVKSSVPTSTIYETADESKEGMNLLTLIAELFNAQVISAKLIYDLIRGFLEAPAPDGQVMGEIEVERLLKVLRCELIVDPSDLRFGTAVAPRGSGKSERHCQFGTGKDQGQGKDHDVSMVNII